MTATPAHATVAGGITTTWDASTKTITQTYDAPGYDGWPGPMAAINPTPFNSTFCPECPQSWSEVDRVDVHFPQRFTLYVTPWIFEEATTQIHVHAPLNPAEPDTLVGISLVNGGGSATPTDRWNHGYRVAYVGKTVDFGMDGRADVIVEASDWAAPVNDLGDGADVLDLRKMTNVQYPRDRRGNPLIPLGGCRCNGGNDRYFGHAGIGKSTISLGSGNDVAWVETTGGSHVTAGPGNDVVHGGPGGDVIYGGDTLRGGVDILFGHGGRDQLAKYGSGRAILNGGPGADYFSGGLGNDLIIAGGPPFDRAGDLMQGAGGNDRYVGSAGSDHVLDPWGSTIASLGAGRDTIKVDSRRRHRINCGAGLTDWIFQRVTTTIGCERSGRG